MLFLIFYIFWILLTINDWKNIFSLQQLSYYVKLSTVNVFFKYTYYVYYRFFCLGKVYMFRGGKGDCLTCTIQDAL